MTSLYFVFQTKSLLINIINYITLPFD